MSRKGELWRGDLAQHIEAYLAGEESADDLADWAMDHPFFDDRTEMSDDEQRIIAQALGAVLQMDPAQPPGTRTTNAQLRDIVGVLWQRSDSAG
jgi:hypothetical protein